MRRRASALRSPTSPATSARACIGQYFSMLEAAIVLAVIVRDHELTSLADRVPLAPRITLHPAAPVPSRLTQPARVARRAVGVLPGPGR
jgi:hypothetical protein